MSCNTIEDSGCAACPERSDVQPEPLDHGGALPGLRGRHDLRAMQLIKERQEEGTAGLAGRLGALLTIPRYLICASCSGYGKMCYSFYLGKYTSMIFPKREKEVPMIGFALEVLSLSAITFAPALAMREDRKKLMTYLILMDLVMAGQFFHACRYCGTHAEDEFKKHCPNHRFWRSFR